MRKLYGSVNGLSKQVKTLYGSVNGQSKELTKLYGSVNGVSKLIYEKAPATVDYGIVYYIDLSDPTYTVQSVELQSQAEFDSLCAPEWGVNYWTATVGGGSVTVSNNGAGGLPVIIGVEIGELITTINDCFLFGCVYLERSLIVSANVTAIGDFFLSGCSYFNQSLSLPSGLTSIGVEFLSNCTYFDQSFIMPGSVTSIGEGFLGACTSFNQGFNLPNSLATIDDYFMWGCTSFNQNLTLPSSLTSIGESFLSSCSSMTSTVTVGSLPATVIAESNGSFSADSSSDACYTTGISIAGSNRAAWLSRFPNRTSIPYRKLLDAGH